MDLLDTRVIALRVGPDRTDADAGVIHQNVEAAEVLDTFGDPIVARCFVGYVAGNRHGANARELFADLFGNVCRGLSADVEDRRVNAIRRQRLRHGLAQTAGAAGDESRFPCIGHGHEVSV